MSGLTGLAGYSYGRAIGKVIGEVKPVPVDVDDRQEIAAFIVGLRHTSTALNRVLTLENLRSVVRYFDDEYQSELFGVIGRLEEEEKADGNTRATLR